MNISGLVNILEQVVELTLVSWTILLIIGNAFYLSCLGSFLLINMKEAGDRGVNAGTNCELKTLSNIDFGGGAEEHPDDGNDDVEDIV